MKDKSAESRDREENKMPQDAKAPDNEEFKVDDRRHWSVEEEEEAAKEDQVEPARPTIIDEYRKRAEGAEQKLQEYIEAYKSYQQEQEDFRARMSRDVERRVGLQFGELVSQLLQTVDDLDLGLTHVHDVPEAEPLAKGVVMARDRFLSTLEQHGICRVAPTGDSFDPNVAEALRVDPVTDPELDGKVTETLQPGYRLGDRVIRAARVAVGRYVSDDC